MEMANYILRILRSQLTIMLSWGFNHPTALPNNEGLRFNVQGFKFKGTVEEKTDDYQNRVKEEYSLIMF